MRLRRLRSRSASCAAFSAAISSGVLSRSDTRLALASAASSRASRSKSSSSSSSSSTARRRCSLPALRWPVEVRRLPRSTPPWWVKPRVSQWSIAGEREPTHIGQRLEHAVQLVQMLVVSLLFLGPLAFGGLALCHDLSHHLGGGVQHSAQEQPMGRCAPPSSTFGPPQWPPPLHQAPSW